MSVRSSDNKSVRSSDNKSVEKVEQKTRNICKTVLLGHINTGKSTLCTKLLNIEREYMSSTIGIDFCTIKMNNYILNVIDTAGHERYASLVQSYWRNAYFIIGVISLQLDEINTSIKTMIQYLDTLYKEESTSYFILWFTKLDLYSGMSVDSKDEFIIEQLKFDYEELFNHPYLEKNLLFTFIVNQKDNKDITKKKTNLLNIIDSYYTQTNSVKNIKLEEYCKLKSTDNNCCK